MMFVLSMAGGHAIRGGMAINIAGNLRENEIYGPALNCAYNIENNIAQYPRMVIDDSVLGYLDDHKKDSGTGIISAINRKTAQDCIDMIKTDIDGYPILDYLGEGYKKTLSAESIFPVKEAYEFVKSQVGLWEKSRNTKLAQRYHMLQVYFQSRLKLWEK
jgi:hypothetical protein